MNRKLLIFSMILIIAGSSCDKWQDADDSEVVARVDEFYLTINQVKSLIPPYLSVEEKRSVSEKIVESWVVNQILYQNALKDNMTLSNTQRYYLNGLEQEYIIQNYLDVQAIELKKSITESALAKYYNEHKDDYLFEEPTVRLSQIVFETRVNDIFEEIRTVGNLDTILQKYRLQSRPGESGINGDLGYVSESSLTALIYRRTRYLKVGEYTGPITIDNKFVFVQVTDRKKAGDPIPLFIVKDEITRILEFQQLQKLKDDLVKNRKTDFIIETFMSRLEYGVLN